LGSIEKHQGSPHHKAKDDIALADYQFDVPCHMLFRTYVEILPPEQPHSTRQHSKPEKNQLIFGFGFLSGSLTPSQSSTSNHSASKLHIYDMDTQHLNSLPQTLTPTHRSSRTSWSY